MEPQLDLLGDEEENGGVSNAILVSLAVHVALIIWVVLFYHPVAASTPAPPIAHYVELMSQQPKQFTEAPGRKRETAPLNAPWSDANRKASSPNRTGDQLTNRPGDGSQTYTPPKGAASPAPRQEAQQAIQQQAQRPQQQAPQQQQQSPQQQAEAMQATPADLARARESPTFKYHPSVAAAGAVDWKQAIQQAGKVASLGGGQDGPDFGQLGGDKGYSADNGPLSFESQWFDWGDYAQGMVNRIKVNWYGNMPQLIKMGVKGVATIRFTIHKDGRISDVTLLSSSNVPPYDFAARKAIELSSPLNPLPKDFPNESERVTCQFYYNTEVPHQR